MRAFRFFYVFCAMLFSATLWSSAQAADLKIGTRNLPSIDPHFLFVDSNVAFSYHL